MSGGPTIAEDARLESDISDAMVRLYSEYYGHDRTTATSYINDEVVLCLLQRSIDKHEQDEIAEGRGAKVIRKRVAFQVGEEDNFSREIEGLTGRRVIAFLSANQTSLDFAAELFVLDGPPRRHETGRP
ncbi:MAG TPA: Na-translocating system protein MpsC family protein [Solirubrobacterales bacterium]|jgi:uncharacterized protein YbcI|nr:Na-translocating system protein MpsC family protein [Solirubrobacterales bacterium]